MSTIEGGRTGELLARTGRDVDVEHTLRGMVLP